jgi:hypothetical protein
MKASFKNDIMDGLRRRTITFFDNLQANAKMKLEKAQDEHGNVSEII